MPTLPVAIDARRALEGARKYRQATESMNRGSDRARRGVERLERRTASLGAVASRAKLAIGGLFAGLGATVALRSAISTIARFEETMGTVRGITRATNEDFAALSEQARSLGATTRFSAAEAADGLLFLARAGFETNESLSALPSTLQLAQAGAIELGEAADIASNVLAQFRLEAEDMVRVADILIMTANSANTDVRQLAEALSKTGPIAGALGISLEETAAAVGTLGNAGIQASVAGTNLRGVLAALLGPTDKAKSSIRALGLSIADVDPSTRSLIEIFKTFRDASLQAQDAVNIFGRRNAAASLVITSLIGDFEKLIEANENAAGEAERMAKIMDDNLIGAFKGLISATQELFLQMGDSGLRGVLRTIVDTMTGALRVLGGMEDTLTRNIAASKSLAISLKFLAVSGATFVALQLPSVLLSVAAAITKVTFALAKNPFGLLVIGVSAAIVTLIEYRDTMVTIGDRTVSIGDLVVATWEHVKEKFLFVLDTIQKAWGVVSNALAQIWSAAVNEVLKVIAAIPTGWTEVVKSIIAVAKEAANITVQIFVGMANSIVAVWDNLVIQFKAFAKTIGDIDLMDPQSFLRAFADLTVISTINMKAAGADIAGAFNDAFAKDFLGGIDPKIKTAIAELKSTVAAVFGEDFFGDLNKFFNPAAEIEDILSKAAARRAAREAEEAAKESVAPELTDTTGLLESIEAALAALEEQADDTNKVYEDWVKSLNESLEAIETEILVIRGATSEQLILNQAKARGIELSKEQLNQLTALQETIQARELELQKLQQLQDLYQDLGDTIGGVFQEVIFGGESAAKAIENMVRRVSELVFEMVVTQQIANAIAGALGSLGVFGGVVQGSAPITAPSVPSEKGNVFGGAHVPFRSGGTLITAPTSFALAGGRVGTAAEYQEEAIFPLTRDSSGNLGVRGAGSQSVVVNMTVVAQDANSFRRSEGQVIQSLQSRLKRVNRNT